MFKWLEKNFDRIMLVNCILLGVIVLVGAGMAMYNLQNYYGKENICKEGRW